MAHKRASSSATSPSASTPDLSVDGDLADERIIPYDGPSIVRHRARFLRSPSPSSASMSIPATPVTPSVSLRKPIVIASSLIKGPIDKPWLERKERFAWAPRYLFLAMVFLGVAGAAAQIFFGYKSVPRLGNVCLVLDEEFSGDKLDTSVWTREVSLGGWGNGQFEWTTADEANSRVENGVLYITPTLTEEVIGYDAVFNGYNLTLSDCTANNATECNRYSNETANTVINPVRSARLTTKTSKSIKYGRVEVKARMPRGDWLWPAIWMMPVSDFYGPWPRSGEIDIIEARGNDPDAYKGMGSDYLTSTVHWGPAPLMDGFWKTTGWWNDKHISFDQSFHTYGLEWNENFLWTYVDSRVNRIFKLSFSEKKPFFDRGHYPDVIFNGTQMQRLDNPWAGSASPGVAPFDQEFYLILDVAVGGTNGWFPDGKGKKPWVNGASQAMKDFARAKDQWYPTWPTDLKSRSLAVESVKMWQQC
ncbi:concanavalin A-like lectin/glucanase [Auriculariales sp. MPI-PUGE-AT-0066]|nr:concanavalin A-like lectin/glucanase [Auriculariales sp. MPI-PUGE-AT-0066]